jgi:hypothetical protein
MLKEDPKKMAGRTRAQSINESYGAGARDQQTGALLPGRQDYQNMSDAQRDNVLAQIESTAGLTGEQKDVLNKALEGTDKNQWQGKIDAALTAVARNEDVSQAMKNSNNPLGNANASDLLKRAVDSLSQLRDVVNKVEPGYN